MPSYTIQAADGQNYGPVDSEALLNWAREGRLVPATQVYDHDAQQWVEAVSLPLLAPVWASSGSPQSGSPPLPAATARCAECGREFPREEMVAFQNRHVCAACKPVFFQRVREGAPLHRTATGMASLEAVAERDYDLNLGDCIGRSWEKVKTQLGLVIGATIMVYGALMLASLIPYLGNILQLLLTGPITGGLYYFFVKLMRGDEASVGDAFSGFGPRCGSLMLGHIVPTLLTMVLLIPAIVCVVMALISAGGIEHLEKIFQPMGGWLIAAAALGGAGILAMIYLSTGWFFTLPLIIDREMGFWSAMQLSFKVVNKHWFTVFGFMFVNGLLIVVGVLVCCVGVLVTLPIAFGALMCAYDDLFCKP